MITSLEKNIKPVIDRCVEYSLFPTNRIEWVKTLPTVGLENVEYLKEGKIYSYDTNTSTYIELPNYTLIAPTNIRFYKSSYIEFENILEKIKDSAKKFPLIFINSDKVEFSAVGEFMEANIGQIVIATKSNPDWTSDLREVYNFDTILRPLVNTFEVSLQRYGLINTKTKLNYKEHFFFGRSGEYGNTGNLFSDFVDAIEIKNLKVTLKNKC